MNISRMYEYAYCLIYIALIFLYQAMLQIRICTLYCTRKLFRIRFGFCNGFNSAGNFFNEYVINSSVYIYMT